MKLKYGSEVTENYSNNLFSINTYGCLLDSQRQTGKEPFSTIKTVLVEHIQKHYPGYSVSRPTGALDIHIDNRLYSEEFINYLDEMAHELSLYQIRHYIPWTKDGMVEVLNKKPVPAIPNNGQTPVAEKPIDPNKQIRLSKNFIKKDFIPRITQSTDIEKARSNPKFVFFPSKSYPTYNKASVLKESSETNILLLNLIQQRHTQDVPFNILLLLNQQLGVHRDKYGPNTLTSIYKGEFTFMDAESKKIIKSFAPTISAYLKSDGSEEHENKLKDAFKPAIQKERAQAAIAAHLNRILMGPGAPKVKYIHAPGTPDHLKLLSSKITNARNYNDLCDTPLEAFAHAPQLAAAAIVRLVLGCSLMEMKLPNFMAFTLGNQKKVVNIDTDFCFVTTEQEKLKSITTGINGAQNFCPYRPAPGETTDGHKNAWDVIFSNSDETMVTNAMTEILERIAVVLTDEMIEYVVDYITNQEGNEFALSSADRKETVDFLRKSRELVVNKLNELKVTIKEVDPASHAPWAKDLFEEIHNHAAKNSLTK